jgi:superfamily I DNA/RNA helicase
MSDSEVAQALRSNAGLVLIEAPAGFGKTFQGALYAKDLLPKISPGRLLVLTHTNAACDVFATRTNDFGSRVEIRTIDSLITWIATAYHKGLDLPPDVAAWARDESDGFNQLAAKVAGLLGRAPSVSASLAARYPYVVCDEHQDSSEAQHRLIISLHRAGSYVRIFGDPMQAIYGPKDLNAWDRRWSELQGAAERCVALDTPHRWKDCAPELGDWISDARNALKAGREIDLTGNLPRGLLVIRADNTAKRHGLYMVCPTERRPIDNFVGAAVEVLVLASTNDTVRGLRAFFNRSIPIWEGHRRDALSKLIGSCHQHSGNAVSIGEALIEFMQNVATGFSDSAYGNILRREIGDRCISRRTQKPEKIQQLARFIIECPDHRGAADALKRLRDLISTDTTFKDINLDLRREFRESTKLSQYEDANAGFAELTARRTFARLRLPSKAISTIHKAKGLEATRVVVVPCDAEHFAPTDSKRRLLYVALSRATKSLAIVVSRKTPSQLFRV